MDKRLIARYTFEDAKNIGKDSSGNGKILKRELV